MKSGLHGAGRTVVTTVRVFRPDDHEPVIRFFTEFEPKAAFQGLPPRSERLIRRWLDGLAKNASISFVAETGGRVIGHSMLCPASEKSDVELAIFLHQDFRGLGLGKKLLLGTLNYACKRLQVRRVWLSVQGSNLRALNLFKKVGFKSVDGDELSRWEIELERPLSCEPCLGDRCSVFGESVPLEVVISPASPAC